MVERKTLRAKEIYSAYGVSRATFYNLKKLKDFPKPVLLGAQARGYYQDEIDEFFKKRQLAW